MPNPVHDWSWSGRSARLAKLAKIVLLAATLATAGCQSMPECLGDPVPGFSSAALNYWIKADTGDAATRERLWADAQRAREHWKIGLLQSIAASPRYDPEAARKRLRAAIERPPSADVATVAKLRLRQLDTELRYEARVGNLQRQLDAVVAIEQRMERR